MQEINFQRKVTTTGHPTAEMPKKLNIKKKKSGVSKTKNKSVMSPQIILIPKLALKKTKGASFVSPSKNELKRENSELHDENEELKGTLGQVEVKSKEWLSNQQHQFKQAAQTLIEQTEDQKQAELAKQKAVLDAQRVAEIQRQRAQLEREAQQILES